MNIIDELIKFYYFEDNFLNCNTSLLINNSPISGILEFIILIKLPYSSVLVVILIVVSLFLE